MGKRRRQASSKIEAEFPEEDKKKSKLQLEGTQKNFENTCVSPPVKLTRASVSKGKFPIQEKKMDTKKTPASLPSSSPSKFGKITKQEKKVNVNDEIKIATSEKGVPVPNLPDGWRREVVVRKTGKTAGQIDIYFYSPEGTKLRSRPDVASYLAKHKSVLKVEQFDFSKKLKTNETVVKKDCDVKNTSPRNQSKNVQCEKSNEMELKDPSEATSIKKPRSEKSAIQHPPAEAKEEIIPERKAILEEEDDSIKRKDKPLPIMDMVYRPKPPAVQRPSANNFAKMKADREKRMSLREKLASLPFSFPSKLGEMPTSLSFLPPSKLGKITKQENKVNVGEDIKISASEKGVPVPNLQENKVNVGEDIKISASEKGVPVPNLPGGWRRQVVARKTGKTAGQIDIYFYSPDGTKLRSRQDVASYLAKNKIDLKPEEFDFSKTLKIAENVVNDVAENSTAPKNEQAEDSQKNGVELGDPPQAVSAEMSRPVRKFPSQVPPPAGIKGMNLFNLNPKIYKKNLEKRSRR